MCSRFLLVLVLVTARAFDCFHKHYKHLGVVGFRVDWDLKDLGGFTSLSPNDSAPWGDSVENSGIRPCLSGNSSDDFCRPNFVVQFLVVQPAE